MDGKLIYAMQRIEATMLAKMLIKCGIEKPATKEELIALHRELLVSIRYDATCPVNVPNDDKEALRVKKANQISGYDERRE